MWQSVVESWRSLRREQRVSVIFLLMCASLAVGISVYRVRANVLEPFLIDASSIEATKQIVGPTPAEQEAEQKRIDTDGDGVSDWDETNVYHTNSNVRDTCGDGMTDNVRIATGKNLNCSGSTSVIGGRAVSPEGSPTGTKATQDLQGIYSGVFGAPSASVPASSESEAPTALPRDPAAIRGFLMGKVDQVQLQALTDAQLLKLYDDAIAAQQAGAQGAAQTTTTTP